MKNRYLSMFLVICLLLNLLCIPALAAEGEGKENTVTVVEPAPEDSTPEDAYSNGADTATGDNPANNKSEKEKPAEPTEDELALAAWEAALGDFTVTDANAYTPTEAKDLLTAEDTGHAYDLTPEEETEISGEYVPGEVLYARKSGMLNASADRALAALGITNETVVYTQQKRSANGAPLLGASGGETIWFRANISGGVEETVKALKEIDGIVDAEPNYVYTTEVTGQPSETEISNSEKILDPDHDNGLHKGWWKRWWKWWLEQPGHEQYKDVPFPDHLPYEGFDTYEAYFSQFMDDGSTETELPAPGKDVVVAVIDTGVDYTHQDLAAAMWVNSGEIPDNGVDDDNNGYIDDYYGINATANPRFDGAIAGDPMDYNGHGTHVAGIIAMSCNGEGGVGAAYGAKIMAIKAGQSTGTFSSTDIAEAIQYAVTYGADVINMSFGGTGKSSLVEAALQEAFTTCVLVAAAGNDGFPTTDAPEDFIYKEDIYPAGYNFVIGVMATDKNGNLASFSNWDYYGNANCEYELAAPGVNIYSTLPGNRYAEWSGTSMAAPAVAAAAAVIRAAYPDKDEYSSRFIMGQLVSATTQQTVYVDKLGYAHSYAKLDLYDSINYLPKPNLRMAQVFALDNVRAGTENDGDRIMDAGETIDLGVAVRNQWGKSGSITVTASAAENGIPNPYVTFITDTITLDAAGTFQTVDNGFVWDDGLLTDVTNPIRFTLADNTPNDTQIRVYLTVTTSNGLDAGDAAVYTIYPQPTFTFRVQRGAAIRGHITTDTTLTADKYWIVENALLVDEGATLTVQPGTQMQFWSSDYEDAYGELTMVYLANNGTLNMIGAEDNPIELFPSADFENYAVRIYGTGVETLRYCEIMNPSLGVVDEIHGMTISGLPYLDYLDHCSLVQNYDTVFARALDGNEVHTFYCNYQGIGYIKSSIVRNLENPFQPVRVYSISGGTESIFENSDINFDLILINNIEDFEIEHSAFLYDHSKYMLHSSAYKTAPIATPTFSTVFSYEGANSKYVLMNPFLVRAERELASYVAASLGGTLLCFDNKEEEDGFALGALPVLEATHNASEGNSYGRSIFVDYTFDAVSGLWVWGDGSNYEPSGSFSESAPYEYLYIYITPDFSNHQYYGHSESTVRDCYYALEFPLSLSDEEITEALENFEISAWNTSRPGSVYHSAVLNPILDTNVNHWLRFTAPNYNMDVSSPEYNADVYYPLHGNYWGTENSVLINKMIIDDDDFPGTLADIVETPILTLNDDLSTIYPFVTQIWLTEHDGSTVISEAAPGQAVDVHVSFNRDMDTTVQPSITYGGEDPFTDYSVSGNWTSARTWVGTTKISAVATGGNMIFRAKGGRAADDHWLVCGTDTQRFQFTINAASAQSAVLNAAGGAGKVTLNWIQNDYELLGGYNLYRSIDATSGFTKLNSTLLTETSYVDTDVDAGVTYYYYFTMVNTDGDEIADAKSNTVSAAPLDDVNPVVIHTPVTSGRVGQAISISAEASDNIAVTAVTLFYRVPGAGAFQSTAMTYNSTTGRYGATIPATTVGASGVQYYIEARDAAGNTASSGSAAVPFVITTDNRPTLLTVFPQVVNIADIPDSMTIYGTNFSDDMTVKVGTTAITDFTVNSDGTQISFAAPSLAVGAYPVNVTKDGVTVSLASAVVYQDSSSYVQLNPGEGTPGVVLRLPLYAVMSGPMYALRAEIDVPSAYFSAATAVAAEGFDVQMQKSWYNGVLTISMISAEGVTVAANAPIAWVELTPRAADAPTNVQLSLKVAKLNNTSVLSAPIAVTVLITPSYALRATVTYFFGGAPVAGVEITAANASGTTDVDGVVLLENINRKNVDVTAAKTGYDDAIDLLDVLFLLQYLVHDKELGEYQLIAADVDNDGEVSEMDAVMILRKLVKLEDSFTSGAWRFVPATKAMTLAPAAVDVVFVAILMGDVNGSWGTAQ